ncbi:pyridoxamine 5'-phosphate oxidase family protein [Chitinibacteraceae bacterium HSL-7]
MDDLALLARLLSEQRLAALATLHDGDPAISTVPYAATVDGLLIHVSALASHTADLVAHPEVALLITAPDNGDSVLARPRLSVRGRARPLEAGGAEHRQAKARYLEQLPDAEALFGFGDFSLFLIEPTTARLVAGFGRARTLAGHAILEAATP